MTERRRLACEEARPFKEKAISKNQQAAQWNERIKGFKKSKSRDDSAIEEAESKFNELTREAREFAAKARDIEDAVYDLSAANPTKTPVVDARTPEDLIGIIEANERVVTEALAALRMDEVTGS